MINRATGRATTFENVRLEATMAGNAEEPSTSRHLSPMIRSVEKSLTDSWRRTLDPDRRLDMLDDVRWAVLHMGCGHRRPTISDGGSFIAVARTKRCLRRQLWPHESRAGGTPKYGGYRLVFIVDGLRNEAQCEWEGT